MAVKRKKGESKVGLVQREFKAGELHSGSKDGPKVKDPKQALAIGLSEKRKEMNTKAHKKKRNIGRGN